MQYDFDEIIDRRGTGALKYEALLPRWGRDDLLPLWVADMDFKTPPFIMEALRRRCEHELLGYTVKPPPFSRPSGPGWAAATAGRWKRTRSGSPPALFRAFPAPSSASPVRGTGS